MRTREYNSPQRMIAKRLFLGLLMLVIGTAYCYAGAPETMWASPSAKLAKEIAAISGPGTAALTIRNQSSISNEDVPAIRRGLEAQLQIAGIQVRSAENAATTITITLSENLQGWLWVADVAQGSDAKVALVPVPRSGGVAMAQAGPNIVLKKTLVFTQRYAILDFATIHAGVDTHLVILDADNVSLYRATGAGYEREQAFPIAHSRPFPRDLRGRVTLGRDHLFDAYLPGVICSSGISTPINVTCHESDDPWPMGSQKALYNPARNYFTGALLPGIGKPLAPFFAAAELPRSNYTLWITTATDGSVRESDGKNELRIPIAVSEAWGSDLAAVHNACGLGTQLLVTGSGAGPDTLRAFEVPDREPVQVSAPLNFDGPITALWTSSDGTYGNLVSQNPNGGRYEAYSVSVACNQ